MKENETTKETKMSQANKFKLEGSVQSTGICVDVSIKLDSLAAAVTLCNTFPKRLKVRSYSVCGMQNGTWSDFLYAVVEIRANLLPTGITGSANEFGAKRIRDFLARIDWEWNRKQCSNFATEEQLKTAIGV